MKKIHVLTSPCCLTSHHDDNVCVYLFTWCTTTGRKAEVPVARALNVVERRLLRSMVRADVESNMLVY